jgi:hypothetical protein
MATTAQRLTALEAWRKTVDARLTALETPVAPVPAPIVYAPSVTLRPTTGQTVAAKSFTQLDYGVIWNDGPDNVTLTDLIMDRCTYGLKLGASAVAGNQATGLVASNIVAKGGVMGAFLANITGGRFDDWQLQSVSSDPHNHALYLERECHNLLFEGFRGSVSGATGYCINMYASGAFVSDYIGFLDTVLDASAGGLGPLTINWPYRLVRFEGAVLKQQLGVARPVIMLGECSDVVIDGFIAEGGNALIGAFGGTVPARITLRNGTYKGARLPVFPWLTLENVRLV